LVTWILVGFKFTMRRRANGQKAHNIELELDPCFLRTDHVPVVDRTECAPEDSDTHYERTCPSPSTTYLYEHSSRRAMGPRAWSFWVELPISAPRPNSPPSVKRVEAFTYTHAASTPSWKARAAAVSRVTIASEWPLPCSAMCSIASSSESTTRTASVMARYSVAQSSSCACSIGAAPPASSRARSSPRSSTPAACS